MLWSSSSTRTFPDDWTGFFGTKMNTRAVSCDYPMADSEYAFKGFNFERLLPATFIRVSSTLAGMN